MSPRMLEEIDYGTHEVRLQAAHTDVAFGQHLPYVSRICHVKSEFPNPAVGAAFGVHSEPAERHLSANQAGCKATKVTQC